MKTPLPEDINQQMNEYRRDMALLPSAYIAFHKQLADKELDRLRAAGLEVLNTEMKSDGWMDGMKVLHVRAIQHSGNAEAVVYLHWHDGNQEFFIKSPSGGSFPYRLEGV